MSLVICSKCGDLRDTDFHEGEYTSEDDFICDYCGGIK